MLPDRTTVLTDIEMHMLLTTETENQWNETCDCIKRARGGEYPQDWFEKVILSRIVRKHMENWRPERPLPRTESQLIHLILQSGVKDAR